jgi:hypothetical protein
MRSTPNSEAGRPFHAMISMRKEFFSLQLRRKRRKGFSPWPSTRKGLRRWFCNGLHAFDLFFKIVQYIFRIKIEESLTATDTTRTIQQGTKGRQREHLIQRNYSLHGGDEDDHNHKTHRRGTGGAAPSRPPHRRRRTLDQLRLLDESSPDYRRQPLQ